MYRIVSTAIWCMSESKNSIKVVIFKFSHTHMAKTCSFLGALLGPPSTETEELRQDKGPKNQFKFYK